MKERENERKKNEISDVFCCHLYIKKKLKKERKKERMKERENERKKNEISDVFCCHL